MRIHLLLLATIVAILLPHPAWADGEDDDWVRGEIIVTLQPGADIDAFNLRYGTITLDAYPPAALYLLFFDGPEDLLEEEMDEDPDVLAADLNMIQETPEAIRQLVLIAVGGDYVDYIDQHLTERIGLDQAHAHTRGAGVRVAIVDSGVDPTHEALVGHLATDGYDFVDEDGDPTEMANGLDDDGDLLVDEGFGHGTMVAGIVALVAPEAEILPLRVLDDEGRTTAFRVCKAIRYADDHGAQIINLSLGVPQEVEAIGFQLDAITEHGALVIAGAGNESRTAPAYYPAADENAVMVTALDSLDVKADFADWGSKVEVCSPGTGVRSAYPGGQWALGSGCSFATPFVTGAAVLYISAGLASDEEELRELLAEAVEPVDGIAENAPFQGGLGSGRIYLPAAFPTTGTQEVDLTALGGVNVAPNPSQGIVELDFTGMDWNPNRVRIFDIAGRQVRNWFLGARGTSSSRISWDGRTADGRTVPAGLYFAHVTAPGRSLAAIPIVRAR